MNLNKSFLPAGDLHEALTFGLLEEERMVQAICGVGDIHSKEQGSGARYNAGKPPFDLVPIRLLVAQHARHGHSGDRLAAVYILGCLAEWQERSERVDILESAFMHAGIEAWDNCAKVFDYGRGKYFAWNWAKGMAWSIPLACAVRHIRAILNFEEIDPESKLPHMGHVMCNLVMLATYQATFPSGDDRPAAGLLAPVFPTIEQAMA